MAGNLLRRGAERLAAVRTAIYSEPVTLQRRSWETTGVPAAICRTQDIRDDGDIVVAEEVRDFKIAAADYQFDGEVTEPKAGDRIIDSSTGEAITYMVLPITGEVAARWSDVYGVSWRIHTKRKNV